MQNAAVNHNETFIVALTDSEIGAITYALLTRKNVILERMGKPQSEIAKQYDEREFGRIVKLLNDFTNLI